MAVVVARLALIIYFSGSPLNLPDIESSVYTIRGFVYWEYSQNPGAVFYMN
jgi:hypothetical protein